jgi:hypothetical protein
VGSQEVCPSTEALQGSVSASLHWTFDYDQLMNSLSIEFLHFLSLLCRHHHNGRWEARIGRVLGNKYLYLGTYGEFLLI